MTPTIQGVHCAPPTRSSTAGTIPRSNRNAAAARRIGVWPLDRTAAASALQIG